MAARGTARNHLVPGTTGYHFRLFMPCALDHGEPRAACRQIDVGTTVSGRRVSTEQAAYFPRRTSRVSDPLLDAYAERLSSRKSRLRGRDYVGAWHHPGRPGAWHL